MHKTKYSGDYESFVKIRDASDGWQLIKKHWRGERIHANATLIYLSFFFENSTVFETLASLLKL